jgi:hypothetical protein
MSRKLLIRGKAKLEKQLPLNQYLSEKYKDENEYLPTEQELYLAWLNECWNPFCQSLKSERKSIIVDESNPFFYWRNEELVNDRSCLKGGWITKSNRYLKMNTANTFNWKDSNFYYYVPTKYIPKDRWKINESALTDVDILDVDPEIIWFVKRACDFQELAVDLIEANGGDSKCFAEHSFYKPLAQIIYAQNIPEINFYLDLFDPSGSNHPDYLSKQQAYYQSFL